MLYEIALAKNFGVSATRSKIGNWYTQGISIVAELARFPALINVNERDIQKKRDILIIA